MQISEILKNSPNTPIPRAEQSSLPIKSCLELDWHSHTTQDPSDLPPFHHMTTTTTIYLLSYTVVPSHYQSLDLPDEFFLLGHPLNYRSHISKFLPI